MKNIAFILVEPQLGENMGSIARIMSNFGLSDLRIVNPRHGWPNPKAIELAAHGRFILDKAKIFPDMRSAMADRTVIIASTATKRNLDKSILTPKDSIEIVNTGAKIAYLFGRERTGLTNEELSYATHIVTIPTSKLNKSLNIAQAAAVIAYEIFARYFNNNFVYQLATSEEKLLMVDHLTEALDGTHFFRVTEKREGMLKNIRNMMMKCNFTSQEVSTLRGVIRALQYDSGNKV